MYALPNGYRIAPLNSDRCDEFINIFAKSVGKSKPLAYFKYNNSSTPAGDPIRFVLIHGDRLIGSHTIRPLHLRIEGQNVTAGLTMDSFIHPDFRNRGLFSALVQRTSAEASRRNWKVIFGFANQNSIGAYSRYLGHTELKPLQYVRVHICICERGNPANELDHILPQYAEEVLRHDIHAAQFPVLVSKNLEYIEWRYLGSPESRYSLLAKEGKYIAILKSYQGEIQIVDFFCTDSAYLDSLLGVSFHFAQRKNKTLSLWIPEMHPMFELIRRGRYSVSPAPQHFHIRCLDPELSGRVLCFNKWHYVMGDSDVF